MRCTNHPSIETDFWCKACKQPICEQCDLAQDPKIHQCAKCVASSAVEDFDRESESLAENLAAIEEKSEQQQARATRIKWSIVLAAVIIVPWRLSSYFEIDPSVISALPIYEKDLVDECIYTLLEVSDLLQAGLRPPLDMRCAGSNLSLLVQESASNTIVSVQDPQNFGFSTMSVSQNDPIPRLVD